MKSTLSCEKANVGWWSLDLKIDINNTLHGLVEEK